MQRISNISSITLWFRKISKGESRELRNSNVYTFIFAFIVCMTCSFLISAVSEGLKAKKELNEVIDVKKNILRAVDVVPPLPKKTDAATLLENYRTKIEEVVIDNVGNILEGISPDDIGEGEDKYPLYIYKEEDQIKSYCFPIEGKGLWSTLYGYLALESDAVTVRGITFYKHGETPGLGAEIEKDWFLNNFKGKNIWDVEKRELRPIVVLKGKVSDLVTEAESKFYVDGISGATMTSKGVSDLLEKSLKIYELFLNKVRRF